MRRLKVKPFDMSARIHNRVSSESLEKPGSRPRHFDGKLLLFGRVFAGLTVLIINACLSANTIDPDQSEPVNKSTALEANSIQIQILSIGRGVPEDTQQAYREIKELTEQSGNSGFAIRVTERVLGFEGERQLCIEVNDSALAEELFGEISAMAQNMELMRVSREQCGIAPEQQSEEKYHEP